MVAGTVWSIAINSICIEHKSWLVVAVVTRFRLHMHELISMALTTAGGGVQQMNMDAPKFAADSLIGTNSIMAGSIM